MDQERLSTGIEELDNLIEGGIPKGYIILLTGNPGSGKTILCSQYLYCGLESGEPGIYVSFTENKQNFLSNMRKLNMHFEDYESKGIFKFLDFPAMKESGIGSALERIFIEVDSLKAKRLIIDSISALNEAFQERIDIRIMLQTAIGKVANAFGVTTILISEKTNDFPLNDERIAFLVDGIIVLDSTTNKGHLERKLQVTKMRGTRINATQQRYCITEKGIVVYPRYEINLDQDASTDRVKTGVKGLDQMLHGGLYKGSTTMVKGASGTGKTSLCLHFIIQGARSKERCLLISFEEPRQQLLRHARSFGWRIADYIENGTIRIISYHPYGCNVEELLSHSKNSLEEQKAKRLVIDSITSLAKSLTSDDYIYYIKALEFYIKKNLTTAMFTASDEEDVPLGYTSTSSFVDNLIALKHVEMRSELKRSIVIFKARGMSHDREIREFDITSKGIVVKDKFATLEKIL